eukprot:TRINITY_DN17704_c0_g1_i1.p1 TRINITY_DN17704_c0_g1~~TRINITY_DN17704_c0_g1_i1.p1  ORF type:complete len:749 (+),score=118.91 TRINITY_DN17704_c0_g1_i1:117-2363(+)
MFIPLLLSAAALCAPSSVFIESSRDATGAFNIVVDGRVWLTGGNATFFSGGKWLSKADGSLKIDQKEVEGVDEFGHFVAAHFTFVGTSSPFHVEAMAKNYDDGFAAFDLEYIIEINNTNSSDQDGVSATYPSFDLDLPTGAPKIGVMGLTGPFIDKTSSGPIMGMWPDAISIGRECGPTVLFDDNHTVVISASSAFMVHSFAVIGNAFAAGIMGSVKQVPAGFKISTILSGGSAGINNEIQVWGDRLRGRYQKNWDTYNTDFTAQHLGYNTDHGTYYYYNPTQLNYTGALLQVKKAANEKKIPFRHVLLDSWWYVRGADNGVSNWTAAPGTFYANGGDADLVRLHQETEWPVIAHNRYWSASTTYAKYNGGTFDFSPVVNGSYVLPLEQRFWDELIGNATKWGLRTYEQDWLFNEFRNVPLIYETTTWGRKWLMQMGEAASKHNINIQYCMPWPRHALQSLEIQPVSQIRASGDYVPQNNQPSDNWNIGGSSILAHALALRPFKDSFWSMVQEPGSSCNDTLNPDIERAAAVATLSAGPVTSGDGADYLNATLIMKSTRADGVLLHPSRPCTFIDSFIRASAGQGNGPKGHVWSTFSLVNQSRHDIVFTTELNETYSLRPSELNLRGPRRSIEMVAFSTTPTAVSTFSETSPLMLRKTMWHGDIALYYTSPVQSNGWALLGELDKWVPASGNRFLSVSVDGNDLIATCMGSAGETVHVSFAKDSKITTVTCTFKEELLRVSSNTTCFF